MIRAALVSGAKVAWSRVSGRSGATVSALVVVGAIALGLVARGVSSVGAGDRAVAGVFRIVLPLASFALVELVSGRARLAEALWPLARFGHPRWAVALGHLAIAASISVLLGVLSVDVALFASRVGIEPRPGELGLVLDVATTSWIAALTAISYSAWFTLGSTFGRRGGGRRIVLLADFLLGTVGVMGALLPRGAAYGLIGLATPLELPRRALGALLAVVAAGVSALVAVRSRR